MSRVKEAIKEGEIPPKSKIPELIPRNTCFITARRNSWPVTSTQPSRTISQTTLKIVPSYVAHLEAQKDLPCQVNIHSIHVFLFPDIAHGFVTGFDTSCFH